MKQLQNYSFSYSPDKKHLALSVWMFHKKPESPTLIYDGGQHGLLYVTPDSRPVIVDYIAQNVRLDLMGRKEVTLLELDEKTNQIKRQTPVKIKKVKLMPPFELEITQEEVILDQVQETEIVQEKGYYVFPRKDDGLLITIKALKSKQDNPVLFYNGAEHALLKVSDKTTVILDYLDPKIRPVLLNSKSVWICECDYPTKQLVREYPALVARVEEFPEIELELTLQQAMQKYLTLQEIEEFYVFVFNKHDELSLVMFQRGERGKRAILTYDGKSDTAFLYKNATECVPLVKLDAKIRKNLLKYDKIHVYEYDPIQNKKAYSYTATVKKG